LPDLPEAVNAANLVALVEATQGHQRAGYFPGQLAEYGEDVRGRLEQGLTVRALDYLQARSIVAQSRASFHSALRRVDAIVAPTTPITAPPVGSETVRVGGIEESVRSALVRLNRPGNFTGLPTISIPCGFARNGLPIGLQFIGRAFQEGALLRLARSYEQSHEWRFRHPAGY
jgi:aspartyl-tRNA(Asn)/glutamyl-tRNA(Gln) amidotransferase subunit A